jgi:arginyl-tRNA--protein-N-Asp/Glu arginylyltransferase
MKTIINNVYGEIGRFDVQVFHLKLELEESKEHEALDSGWSIHNNIWYQSRLTRIDLQRYDKTPKQIKNYSFTYVDKDPPMTEIKNVFNKFVELRGFAYLYDITSDSDRSSWLIVKRSDEIVAFTKFIKYDGGLESQFTAWDYSEPRLSIGTKIVDYEVEIAKKMGLRYLYIGPGYGKAAYYKYKFKGFEWWTGSEWRTDTEEYKSICDRDSGINTLEDLYKLIREKSCQV